MLEDMKRRKPSLVVFALLQTVTMSRPCWGAAADIPLLTNTQSPQQTTTVSLSAVFDESLANSPRAATIRSQLGITRAAYSQAVVLPNPSFFFLRDKAQLARQYGAVVPIEPPWKMAFRLLLAKSQVMQTDLEIQRNLWQFRTTVRRAYLEAVMSVESSEILAELHGITSELLTVAKKRLKAEDVATLDVNRAELAYLQTEADLMQARRRVQQGKQKLSVLMGRSYTTNIDVHRLPSVSVQVPNNELLPDFDKPLPELSDLVSEALKTRLDIKVTKQALLVNRGSRRTALGNILPNPQIDAGFSYSGNPPEGPATRGYFFAINQPIPIFDFQQGELARLRAQRIQLGREVESTTNLATEEVVSAYQSLAAARERVLYYHERIFPVADQVAVKARRAYEVGQTDITAAMSAQQSYIQTKLSYLDTVKSYQQALTDLEQSIGRPL